jgi:hypothetical protein
MKKQRQGHHNLSGPNGRRHFMLVYKMTTYVSGLVDGNFCQTLIDGFHLKKWRLLPVA